MSAEVRSFCAWFLPTIISSVFDITLLFCYIYLFSSQSLFLSFLSPPPSSLSLCVCVYICTHANGREWGLEENCSSRFSPFTMRVLGLNSGHQAWWQASLPTESILWTWAISLFEYQQSQLCFLKSAEVPTDDNPAAAAMDGCRETP